MIVATSSHMTTGSSNNRMTTDKGPCMTIGSSPCTTIGNSHSMTTGILVIRIVGHRLASTWEEAPRASTCRTNPIIEQACQVNSIKPHSLIDLAQ